MIKKIAFLLFCLFTLLPLTAQIRINMGEDSPIRKLQIAEMAITNFYVDSVVYMTKDEYKADKKLSWGERRERSGYTEADIDRLKQKLNVPPLSAEVRQRMEDQLDWEDAQAQWEQLDKVLKATKKAGSKMMESEAFQQMEQKVQQQVEKMSERKQDEGE